VADPTRRGIFERLGRGEASISDLAGRFRMTLTGMKKHVRVLEQAGLVTTRKVGRVRTCRVGPRRLDDEAKWIEKYREMLEDRFNRLGDFLERTGYVAIDTVVLTDLGDGRARLVNTSIFHTKEERDAAMGSGMEQGLNDSYAALDRLLATID